MEDLFIDWGKWWKKKKTHLPDIVLAATVFSFPSRHRLWLVTRDGTFGELFNRHRQAKEKRCRAVKAGPFVQRFCEKAGELEDEGRWPPKRCFWQHWAKDLAW